MRRFVLSFIVSALFVPAALACSAPSGEPGSDEDSVESSLVAPAPGAPFEERSGWEAGAPKMQPGRLVAPSWEHEAAWDAGPRPTMKDGVLAPLSAAESARGWDGAPPSTVKAARLAPFADGEREAAWDGGARPTMREREGEASSDAERAAWKAGERASLLGDSEKTADSLPSTRAGWDAAHDTMKEDEGPPSRRAMWMDAGP
jgi:hypothetical protein